jgi:hypothetical protein
LYQVLTRTSATSGTIKTPSTYTNQTSTAFYKWHNIFGIQTANITNTTLKEITTFSLPQSGYVLNQTDSIGCLLFGSTTSATSIVLNYAINGNVNYSHFETPLIRPRKSVLIQAVGLVGINPRQINRLLTSNTGSYNFYVPQDAQYIDDIQLLFIPEGSSSGLNIDITVNYTVSPNGSGTEFSASDTTSTYIFTGGNINRISLMSLITSAKFGTNGSVVVTNHDAIDMDIVGVETFYR